MTEYGERYGNEEAADDQLSLRPAIQILWSYRRVIVLGIALVVLGYALVVVFRYATAAKETVGLISFRLTFEGAEQERFPNGTKFSSGEIVASPVVSEVFRRNDLARYGSLTDIKDSLFVLQANPDVELLAYEYQGKLADTKLTPVDRARIEEEFRTKRDSLKSAQYSLNMRQGSRLKSIPAPLMNKVLQDTLSIWAEQAAARKGAIRYDIPVLSNNALKKDFVSTEDYVVAADILRSMAERVLKTIQQISDIPGAAAVRVGQEQVGMADVRANVEDLIRFRIEPLVALIRSNGLSRSASRLDVYFQGRLSEVQRNREESLQRIQALQEALRAYLQKTAPNIGGNPIAGDTGPGGNVTPQLSESFIDRIVDLSNKGNDLKYRQDFSERIIREGLQLAEYSKQAEYYQSMQRAFGSPHGGNTQALEADVMRRMNAQFDEMTGAMNQVQAIYKVVAEQDLNPNTILYSITSPFVTRTTSSLNVRNVVVYFFVTLVAAGILVPLACLLHAYFRQSIVPVHPTASAGS